MADHRSGQLFQRLLKGSKGLLWPLLKDTSLATALRAVRRKINRLLNAANPHAPKGFIYSIDEWISEDQKHSSLLDNQPPSCLVFAIPAEQKIVFDPLFSSHEMLPFWQRIRWSLTAEAKLYFLSNARVVGSEGVVVSRDNRVIREFTFPPAPGKWDDLSCFHEPGFGKPNRAVGWYATINYRTSTNYFHWMLECLPRMRLLEKYIPILDGIVMPATLLPFHYESLAVLGVTPEKLIPCTAQMNVELENLFVPKYFSRDNPPTWLHKWYKENFLSAELEALERLPRRKLYISRADAGIRRCDNDDELSARLAKLGFERILLTGMSFMDQARLFFSAEKIVAHHGAGLANLVFCRPDTELLEIFSKHWLAPCFFALARSIGLGYDILIAESDTRPEYTPGDDASVLDASRSASYSVHMPTFLNKVQTFLQSKAIR